MTESLIMQLVAELNKQEVKYCHWKKYDELEHILEGRVDFDLLVDKRSESKLLNIFSEFNIKNMEERWRSEMPGVRHFLGFDAERSTLIHIHLYNKLATGDGFIDSHWLPLEKILLDDVGLLKGIKIPRASASLVHFTLRQAIRDCSIVDWLLGTNGCLVQGRLEWLRQRAAASVCEGCLRSSELLIQPQEFWQYIGSLRKGKMSFERFFLAFKLRRNLRNFARYNLSNYLFAYFSLFYGRIRRGLGEYRAKNKQLAAGGIVIAFVGPEATGKSSLVAEIANWLGSVLRVRTVHVGKPPPSGMLGPVHFLIPFARRLFPGYRSTTIEGLVPAVGDSGRLEEPRYYNKTDRFPSLIYGLRAVMVGWERLQILRKVRRWAADGEIVVCDRYPSSSVGAMDSARLVRSTNETGLSAKIRDVLCRTEQRIYAKIPSPQIVFQLNVPIEVAVKRNEERIKVGKETSAYVIKRHRLNLNWQRPGTEFVFVINTDEEYAATISKVKNMIWNLI